MNNLTDPLAAMKAASPNDPIIPILEHLIHQIDTLKHNAEKIAKAARSLRNSRLGAFFLSGLICAGIGYAAAWWRSPDLNILRQAGIDVRIVNSDQEVQLALIGGKFKKGHVITPEENPDCGYVLIWRKP